MKPTDIDPSSRASIPSAVLVSGASGFVGTQLCTELVRRGFVTRGIVRRPEAALPLNTEPVLVGDLDDSETIRNAVADAPAVVHLAGRAHVLRDSAVDLLAEFRRVNVHGTLNLARHAAEAGVRRFIFISSIKVNGERTPVGRPFTADDIAGPTDPYGVSKHEAEQGLRQLSGVMGMEVVIIRPVLVYGPGVSANFLSMMRWVAAGIPLPFGAVHNKRSLVASSNLVDLIVTCLSHPNAANRTFLVSDGDDVSTTTLLRRIGVALDRPARLVSVPAWLIAGGASVLGKRALARRICGSLQADISKTEALLGWVPRYSMQDALKKTAEHFLINN